MRWDAAGYGVQPASKGTDAASAGAICWLGCSRGTDAGQQGLSLCAGVQLGERMQPASVRYLSAEALCRLWIAGQQGTDAACQQGLSLLAEALCSGLWVQGTDAAGQQGLSVG